MIPIPTVLTLLALFPYLLACADYLSDDFLASLLGKHRSSNAPAIVKTRTIVTRDFRRGACLVWVFLAHQSLLAFDTTAVTIRLRAADGSPVVAEPLQLVTFAAESQADTSATCQTNDEGICRWQVASGLYELLSKRPLDDLSRYAVAEGGLRGLGLTVGDAPITYTLTLQPDNHIYFDTASESPIPEPFIPTMANTHLHGTPSVPSEIADTGEISQTVERAVVISAENTTILDSSVAETVASDSARSDRLLLLIGIGIGAGIGLALWPHLRRWLQGGEHHA